MAKGSSAKKGANGTISTILGYGTPISHSELQPTLATFFHINPENGVMPVWDESKISMSRCPVLIGDKGCGKTTAIRNFCRRYDMDLRFMPTGAVLDEDGLPIPEQLDRAANDRIEFEMWRHAYPSKPITECPVFHRLQVRYNWSKELAAVALEGKDSKSLKSGLSRERRQEVGGIEMASAYNLKPPAWAPLEKPQSKSGRGILFIDETLTASSMQQNQISLAISNRGFGNMQFAEGWYIVGASNPPSDEYYLSCEPDLRLLARLWLIPIKPSPEDTMRHFADQKIMSDRMYGFLMMNKQFIEQVDNRTWEDAGHFEKQHADVGLMSGALFRNILSFRLSPAIVDAYDAYTRFGDDPRYYPIPATTLMNADAAAHKAHMDIVDYWIKEERQAHMANSAHDLIKYARDPEFRITDTQASNICDFLAVLPSTDLIANVLDNTNAGHNSHQLASRLGKSPAAKRLRDVYELDRAEVKGEELKKIPQSKKGKKPSQEQ